MTLSELLEGLKVADPETYEEISHLEFVGWHQPRNQALDHLQGCIQRACERREWTWCIYKQTPEEKNSHYADISKIVSGYDGDYWHEDHESCITWEDANSPAEALLAAYVAAVKKEEKR